MSRRQIKSTDYTNKCGNCHAEMGPKDKYCKYCGTKRGEGLFLPYVNHMYAVYGPPITKEYSCKRCKHKWITVALGGGEDSKYCPECGKKNISQTGISVRSFFETIGLIPDDEEPDRQLLSETQVHTLLSERNEDEEEALLDAGIEKYAKAEDGYELTESEGRRITLARSIHRLAGDDPAAYSDKGICCPQCSSKLLAAIAYPLINDPLAGKEDNHLGERKHVPGNGRELVHETGAVVDWNSLTDGTEWSDRGQAFMCLQCGERFGKFSDYYLK